MQLSIIYLILTVTIIIIDLVITFHILLTKEESPVSALSWVILVWGIPYLGMLLYLFFGINRLPVQSLRVSKAIRDLSRGNSPSTAFSNYLGSIKEYFPQAIQSELHWQSTLDRLFPETAPISGNKIELLEDGTNLYPAMLNAIKKAKHHIHLQSYIILNDKAGKRIFKSLLEKAKQGVQVRVIYDRLGSKALFSSPLYKSWGNKTPNMKIRAFSRINFITPYRIQLRNHRKLLIVDGETAFVGGTNISEENDAASRPKHFTHDLHCKIEGPVVGYLQYSFLRDWYLVLGAKAINLLDDPSYFPIPKTCGSSTVRAISSGPGQHYQGTEKLFLSASVQSKSSLWIMSPYFVPDSAYLKTLIFAAARHVDVRVIVPRKSDHWYVTEACRSRYKVLLEAGVRIFESQSVFNHAKAMLVDGEWALLGSSNCDTRSFKLNYELDVVVNGGTFFKDLHDQFIQELEEANEITLPAHNRRSQARRILQNLCSLFTPVL